MLTTAECDTLERIAMSAIIAITSTFSLFAVPEAIEAIEKALPPDHPPIAGFGSRLNLKHGRILGLQLPVRELRAEPPQQKVWQTGTAALIAAGLLGSAYETISRHRAANDPVWEFMRHTRNASFHGNRFNFEGDEPKRPAIWRGLSITRGIQGQTLFFDFIEFADVFHLLADVTNQIGLPPGEQPMFGIVPEDWMFDS